MGFWDDLTGKTASNAANAAAGDTYNKQQDAIHGLINYGNDYAQNFKDLSTKYDPYVQTGYASNSALNNLIADPSSVRSLPSYGFDFGQGVNAVDHSAAARGMDQSGRTLKDLTRFGTGVADQTYGNQLQRLMALNQQGQGAVGAQNATVGQGLQGQLGTRTSAYGGAMTSAGTIGQGQIAGANAEAAGSQNLLNAGLKLGGMALGAFGGTPGMGATGSSYLGSTMSGGGSNPFNPDGSRNNMAYPR